MISPQFVMDHWPLHEVAVGTTLQSYPTRSIVQLHAQEGDFVAKLDMEPAPAAQALETLSVYSYLSSRGFTHLPYLVLTNSGTPIFYMDGHSTTIMEYIDGGYPEPSAATWQELGRISQKLNSFADFPHPYCIPVKDAIRELTNQANQHPAKAEFLRMIDLLLPLQSYPKQGLVHGEINLRNSMRRQNGELVLIDWDECGTGATILEAGYPLFIVFLTEDLVFHAELAASYYQAYYQHNPPTETDKALLFRSGLLHALRYMHFYNPEKRWERACFAPPTKMNCWPQFSGNPDDEHASGPNSRSTATNALP